MKKFFSSVVFAVMLLGLSTNALAAENDNYAKGINIIEEANSKIDEIIEKAVIKADELQADFILKVRKNEEGKELVKLKKEKEEALVDIEKAKSEDKDVNKAIEKLDKIQNKINEENEKIKKNMESILNEIQEVDALLTSADDDKDKEKLTRKMDKLNAKLSKNGEKSSELLTKYTIDLDKIINETFDKTYLLSLEAIKEVEDYGIIAECSWKLVRFADKFVWIDPIRIVGIR